MEFKRFEFISAEDLLTDPNWLRAITKRRTLAEETAQVLVAARLKMGLTQNELAKKIHTTQSVIARAESGRALPGLSFIERVAKAYRTSARIIFESIPEAVPVAVRYVNLLKANTSNYSGLGSSLKYDWIIMPSRVEAQTKQELIA